MRLTPEQITEEKKYLREFLEMLWFGEHVLTSAERDLFDTIEALQAENEQLQAQVARVRAALTIANNYMPDIGQFCVCGKCKGCGTDIGYSGYEYCLKCARGIIDAALSDTPADYHNPADVEALRKAKEEIQKSLKNYELVGEHEYDISEHLQIALATIDKVIGGKEDE